MKTVEQFWNEYLKAKSLPESTPFTGEITFGSDEHTSNELLALVLSGEKRATFTALASFQIDNESLPKKGANYVLTDFFGNPHGVIQTENITILPYNQITWEMAQKEGEDETFESWRSNHDCFFEEDSDIMGYDFTDRKSVV